MLNSGIHSAPPLQKNVMIINKNKYPYLKRSNFLSENGFVEN